MSEEHGVEKKEPERLGFATTKWSLILKVGEDGSQSSMALEQLCQEYWLPIYAFVVGKTGDPDTSQDITQSFFQDLLHRSLFQNACPEKGRFRAYLLTACKNFLAKHRQAEKALKRGGAEKILSLAFQSKDFQSARQSVLAIASTDLTPEQIFDRQWAMVLLGKVMNNLEEDYQKNGKSESFSLLKDRLTDSRSESNYQELGQRLGISESAVKMQVYRLKKKFRSLLRKEMSQIVGSEDLVDQEIEHLFAAFSR